jgi:hypothetical protein
MFGSKDKAMQESQPQYAHMSLHSHFCVELYKICNGSVL